MSDTENKTVRGTATRDFKDAGSERSYTSGEAYEFSEGEFGNFRFAGLVEPIAETPAVADAGDPAKTGRTRS